MTTATALTEGAVIGERFRLVRLLGEGGMGMVWEATHLVTRKPVALKFLKSNSSNKPEVVRRFLREARAASAVHHPNVVNIHDIIEDDLGLPVMVMDLLQGESLGQRLARETRLPLSELSRILLPVISALGTAHALGIVHRDLKPDNVFLEHLPDGRIEPRVLDFGVAKLSAQEGDAASSGALTNTGAMLGTPYYMAPEQAFGEKDVDHRADVWAMGVILYECLSGRRPVDGDNFGQLLRVLMTGAIPPIESVVPDLPEDIRALIGRMLQTDRSARSPSLRDAYEVLRRHTDALAQSFGDAALPRSFDERGSAPPSDALAPRSSGADAFARTSPSSPPDVRRGRRSLMAPLLLTGVVIAAGSVGLAMKVSRSPPVTEPAAQTTAKLPEASSASASGAVSAAAPVSTASAKPAEAEGAPRAAPSNAGSVPGPRGALPAKSRGQSPPDKPEKPEAPAPVEKAKLPAGMQEAAPF